MRVVLPALALLATLLQGCVWAGTYGQFRLRATTDDTGRVIQAEVLDPVHPNMAEAARRWALREWKGPPHRTKVVRLTFQLDGRITADSAPPAAR